MYTDQMDRVVQKLGNAILRIKVTKALNFLILKKFFSVIFVYLFSSFEPVFCNRNWELEREVYTCIMKSSKLEDEGLSIVERKSCLMEVDFAVRPVDCILCLPNYHHHHHHGHDHHLFAVLK